MKTARLALLLLTLNAALMCGLLQAAAPGTKARDPAPAVAVSADRASTSEPAGEGIACTSDKDCPVMACGPCTPGTPITKAMFPSPSCAVNPCLDASAVCNTGHRCEIGPGTRKNPAVWKQPSR